jgi:hypothetical protein
MVVGGIAAVVVASGLVWVPAGQANGSDNGAARYEVVIVRVGWRG